MNTHLTSESRAKLNRRDVLRAGVLGVTALGLTGMAPLAEAFQGQTAGRAESADRDLSPRNEREWRMQLAALGNLSLLSSTSGVTKAQSAMLKQLATFEKAEQEATVRILREMGTTTPPPNAVEQQVVGAHQNATGAEFDRVFADAQVRVHQQLRELNENFVRQTERARGANERHARHLAMLALPTIIEHITLFGQARDALK